MKRSVYYDLDYDEAGQDFAFSGGDLAEFISTHEELLSQGIQDAMESKFNSEKYTLRNYGFQGRDADFAPKDNIPRQSAELFFREILGRFSYLITTVTKMTPVFTDTGFSVRLECVLSDIQATVFDHTFTWNQSSMRCAVS